MKIADLLDDQTGRGGRGGREQEMDIKSQANANMESVKLLQTLDWKRIPDGSYKDSVRGHQGTLSIEVTISNGRIESVEVTQNQETPSRFVIAQKITHNTYHD
ncbi:FMN-binding protein [Planctomycetota bacterium]